jgi:uncharacterized protein (TIGR02284 family)
MTRTTHSLIELVDALNDGSAFYDHAAQFTRDPIVADAYFRVHHIKAKIAAALAAEISVDPAAVPHNDGAWIAALRARHADIAARIYADPDNAAVAGIGGQEDHVLDAFCLRGASDPSERARNLLAVHLADIQSMHDEITRLPQARAA